MSTSLLRTSARAALRASASASSKRAGLAGVSFTRGKATLPDLPYDYGALEPAISGKIMELHHSKHHNTYVTSYNAAMEKMAAAQSSEDIQSQIALQPLINFHGAPKNQGGGEPPSGNLASAIDKSYGSLDGMKEKFNAALAGIQGSGWAWLVQDTQTGNVMIRTYANRKAEYFNAVWDVVNWKAAEKRMK
ncbi:Superoxide dismutase [Mn], mitochondrial [Cryomyces antarcticus]|uniref:Superoxide dismutase n=1 Tax=Cryomyces antarcticus TaxID=329879 RepID=A0ABR0LXY5_9PEZI|nr:Superoxide dismutase [Mn], mitochondrial [Cryomyces antarcticus]